MFFDSTQAAGVFQRWLRTRKWLVSMWCCRSRKLLHDSTRSFQVGMTLSSHSKNKQTRSTPAKHLTSNSYIQAHMINLPKVLISSIRVACWSARRLLSSPSCAGAHPWKSVLKCTLWKPRAQALREARAGCFARSLSSSSAGHTRQFHSSFCHHCGRTSQEHSTVRSGNVWWCSG